MDSVLNTLNASGQATYFTFSEEPEFDQEEKVSLWTIEGDIIRPPTSLKIRKKFPPGVFKVDISREIGYYCSKINVSSDGLYKFDDEIINDTLIEINKFWDKAEDYKAKKVLHKRGILFYGGPGCGKSSIISLLCSEVIKRNGVIFVVSSVSNLSIYTNFLKHNFRVIEPDTPIITIIEDLDKYTDSDYDIDLAYFTRTRPVQTAAYTRIREYFDFYAVPCDLLWKSFDSAVIQMGEVAPVQSKTLLDPLTVGTDIPYCSLRDLSLAVYYSAGNAPLGQTVTVPSGYGNIFGYNRGDTSAKLLTYLNYGNFVGDESVGDKDNRWWNSSFTAAGVSNYSQRYFNNNFVSLFPLLAYQKIYQDFFRWSQWENADPTAYNVDYYNGSGNLFGPVNIASIIPSESFAIRPAIITAASSNWAIVAAAGPEMPKET